VSDNPLALILSQPCPDCGAQMFETCVLDPHPLPPGVEPADSLEFCAARVRAALGSLN
jgi:hypothetical protein